MVNTVGNMCFRGNIVTCLHGTNFLLSCDCSNCWDASDWPGGSVHHVSILTNIERMDTDGECAVETEGRHSHWGILPLSFTTFWSLSKLWKFLNSRLPFILGEIIKPPHWSYFFLRLKIIAKSSCINEDKLHSTWCISLDQIYEMTKVVVLIPTTGNLYMGQLIKAKKSQFLRINSDYLKFKEEMKLRFYSI